MKNSFLKLCNLALGIASIAPNACRGNWYQPKEPDGLFDFFKQRKELDGVKKDYSTLKGGGQ